MGKFRYHLLLLFVFPLLTATAQELPPGVITPDSLYREDQIYLGFHLNILANRPPEIGTEGLPVGFRLGFIRDMPVNSRRNIALAVGLGYAFNNYRHSVRVNDPVEEIDIFYKSGLNTHKIELPIEFRWRTSTPEEYNFWRIYTGLRLGYLIHDRHWITDEEGLSEQVPLDLSDFQAALSLSMGWGGVNLFVSYSITPLFSGRIDMEDSEHLRAVELGLMFYIL